MRSIPLPQSHSVKDSAANRVAAETGLRVIVTHEQADFDALASLLAARLLDSQALAVLPRRVNRNVRAFLTLYGDALPLVEYEDIPRSRLDRLTIVDMQNVPSIRGFSKKTRVHVVDHHPRDPGLDPSWSVQCEEVGATTTLLAEALEEARVDLKVVQSTLLLMGIYEDTGSLSYLTTSPRDVRACAWLLECGASLSLAGEFLNHPLSEEQRKLYDRLLESAEILEFQGHSIVIACASSEGTLDEISTLAHKLRDLYDPAGIFVIVALDGSVQVVARSTTDALDVSKVADRFGGGGHPRAAAALIRDRTPEEVRAQILALLPSLSSPAKTVGEIMSSGPQLLSPDVPVAEASQRMQRFGHEGYPVVDKGKVVGLLTRRAVDRAMSHQMGNQAVSTIMDAGSVTVRPSDSVQHLQKTMIDHQWGQIPVVEPGTGKIVGIVTRTDLIKTLSPEVERRPSSTLVQELESALPPARLRLLKLVARSAEEIQAALYIVGGFVRDLLLHTPSMDFDLVVEGDAIALAQTLMRAYGGRLSSHRRFGTAKWRLDLQNDGLLRAIGNGHLLKDLPRTLDFVSARTEFYSHPTALPSVERGSIKLDLHRRDFTINTLSLRLDGVHYGQLLDPWGGGRDLEKGVIRVLHSISFVDDPTRMLRAVRLEQRLGFSIEPRTLDLLQQALSLLARVSGERIRSELDLIFGEANLLGMMDRLESLGLLQAIHPKLRWDEWLKDRFVLAREFRPPTEWRLERAIPPPLLLYGLLAFRMSQDEASDFAARLRLPLEETEDVVGGVLVRSTLVDQEPPDAPSVIVEHLDDLREASLVISWLALADQTRARRSVEDYLRSWRHTFPLADGETLRSRGLRPGPVYRSVLQALRAAWLDGRVRSPEEENLLLTELINNVRENPETAKGRGRG